MGVFFNVTYLLISLFIVFFVLTNQVIYAMSKNKKALREERTKARQKKQGKNVLGIIALILLAAFLIMYVFSMYYGAL